MALKTTSGCFVTNDSCDGNYYTLRLEKHTEIATLLTLEVKQVLFLHGDFENFC